jgi:cysteinyl-tRNA synthetase
MQNYGALSMRPLDEMIAGARVDVAPYKRDAMDFVRWKPAQPGEPAWPLPSGIAAPGRPGWHIECSAMSWKHLGERFDIHGGGIDLVFPHHENEVAQSCCAFHTERMAETWMHNGFLQVEGEKMSKSLGNFVTIRELLATDKFGGKRWDGAVLRLAMLKTHYRQPIDWTVDALEEAKKRISKYRKTLEKFGEGKKVDVPYAVVSSLSDDLNTHAVLTELDALNRHANGVTRDGPTSESRSLQSNAVAADQLRASLELLGISLSSEKPGAVNELFDRDVRELLDQRTAARARKDFKESDRIRDELAAMGIAIKDGKDADGKPVTTWEIAR